MRDHETWWLHDAAKASSFDDDGFMGALRVLRLRLSDRKPIVLVLWLFISLVLIDFLVRFDMIRTWLMLVFFSDWWFDHKGKGLNPSLVQGPVDHFLLFL